MKVGGNRNPAVRYVSSDPDGTLTAPTRGTLAIDTTTGIIYQNTNGATTWSVFASGPSTINGTGTANAIPRFTDADTLGNSAITDDGAGVIRASKVGGLSRLKVGDDSELTTAAQNGLQFIAFSDGNNYLDSKVSNTGQTIFRCGHNTEPGGARVWMTVANSSGAVAFAGVVTLNGALDHNGTTVGFYGAAPIAKQTGVAVDAASIHAALVALGLIGA